MSKFTNSPLATIRQLNNAKINGSGNYTRTITKITPHHAAGVINGANLLAWMNNPACGASCNYVIGNDGVIGQQIEECNRAWTSSSPSNDYQAVTIEIGNSTGSPSWQISDKALSVLIDLCVDICKRNPGVKQKNGQPGIYYDGTPNASLTFHEMFASTNCPGAYIKGKVQYICGEVNKRLAAVTPTAPQKPAEPTTPATNSGIKEDGIVEFKSDSTVYYPGSTPIPTWVKSDFYHVVTQTTVGGKPVIKGGVTCVLLGKKINKKTGKQEAGINTWVNPASLSAVSNSDVEKAKEIEVGDIVAIKNGTARYYPGGILIPAWAITDQYHKVTQTTVGGKPVIKGDVTCVLLGKKVEKTRSTESAGINSWIDKGSLIIIRKGG